MSVSTEKRAEITLIIFHDGEGGFSAYAGATERLAKEAVVRSIEDRGDDVDEDIAAREQALALLDAGDLEGAFEVVAAWDGDAHEIVRVPVPGLFAGKLVAVSSENGTSLYTDDPMLAEIEVVTVNTDIDDEANYLSGEIASIEEPSHGSFNALVGSSYPEMKPEFVKAVLGARRASGDGE